MLQSPPTAREEPDDADETDPERPNSVHQRVVIVAPRPGPSQDKHEFDQPKSDRECRPSVHGITAVRFLSLAAKRVNNGVVNSLIKIATMGAINNQALTPCQAAIPKSLKNFIGLCSNFAIICEIENEISGTPYKRSPMWMNTKIRAK